MNARLNVSITYNQTETSSKTHIVDVTDYIAEPVTFSTVGQGGYANASITLACNEYLAWLIISEHVGRRLVITSPEVSNTSRIAWEGQIFTVTVDDGRMAAVRSMQNVFNNVRVEYTSATVIGSVYYEGDTVLTTATNSTTSQNKYGFRELIYPAGVMTSAAAIDFGDRLLNDYALPRSLFNGATLGGASDGTLIVRLECVGWYENYSQRYWVSDDTSTASTHTIIAGMLTYTNTEWTTLQFNNEDQTNIASVGAPGVIQHTGDENIPAAEYINKLTAMGSSSNRRCYFGLYEDGKPYFHEEPTTTRYYIFRGDQSERIYDAVQGRFAMPFDIRPGYWAEIVDLFPHSQTTYTSIAQNPRAFVIGSVDFTAPNIVTLRPVTSDSAALTTARMDWLSTMMPYMFRLIDAPAPQEDAPIGGVPTPRPWDEWLRDNPNVPIPLDPTQPPPGWQPPYHGMPDPGTTLPPPGAMP